jgi:hypothetical protein
VCALFCKLAVRVDGAGCVCLRQQLATCIFCPSARVGALDPIFHLSAADHSILPMILGTHYPRPRSRAAHWIGRMSCAHARVKSVGRSRAGTVCRWKARSCAQIARPQRDVALRRGSVGFGLPGSLRIGRAQSEILAQCMLIEQSVVLSPTRSREHAVERTTLSPSFSAVRDVVKITSRRATRAHTNL